MGQKNEGLREIAKRYERVIKESLYFGLLGLKNKILLGLFILK